MLHEESEGGGYSVRESMWELAEAKLTVYRDNRSILLQTLEDRLGRYKEYFDWTTPDGGFFSVFTFLRSKVAAPVVTDDRLIEQLVSEHGIVVIPMYDFYPEDARSRNPGAGMNQLRLSFCFSESSGEVRRRDMKEAVEAFCDAAIRLAVPESERS